mgnify:CR=1 FL=1
MIQVLKKVKYGKHRVLSVHIEDLRAHVYTETGDLYLPIIETPAYAYLAGDRLVYHKYHAFENNYNIHTSKKFDLLIASLKRKGYSSKNLIVTFNRDNIIRDGQHRAAILHRNFGNVLINILDIEVEGFQKNLTK